ncbi:MAG: LysM peptidoglycan-binding domain-containing protein [Myxococcota bacterium]
MRVSLLPRWVRLAALTALVGSWFDLTPASAQAIYSHPVQEGDTLASIAERYYGDPTREAVLREANRMRTDTSPLVPGSWLLIPTVAYYEVHSDDTWKSIALTLYGSEDRAAILTDANSASRRREPDEGTELLVPYPLRHVVAPGETLAKIAALYLADDSQGLKRLRRFNPGARIERGRVVLVPLAGLRLVGEGRADAREAFEQAAGGGASRRVQEEVEALMPELIKQVQLGKFEEAVALANRMLGMRRLTSSQTVTIQKELAVAYVALERIDLAEASFRTALSLQPNLELDSVRTSPRVLEAFNRSKRALTQ